MGEEESLLIFHRKSLIVIPLVLAKIIGIIFEVLDQDKKSQLHDVINILLNVKYKVVKVVKFPVVVDY